MTVYDNLAFPLRNRGIAEPEIRAKVHEIARMLDLEATLGKRAAGLTADGKQKISLGRGLVRSDVNVIMFDEPLTVIDPHLKWQLRSKLKELHQRIARTMIYVTHDQTEALTFADTVVVMHDGMVVQVGSPVDLFERPRHTFVGHFIGSPGMNVLPCQVSNGTATFAGHPVPVQNPPAQPLNGKQVEIGVRPEFVNLAADGIPVRLAKVSDGGRYRVVEALHGEIRIKLLVDESAPLPADGAHIRFDPAHTRLYADGWLVS
jgi:glycerol transport system ATP-binding protein